MYKYGRMATTFIIAKLFLDGSGLFLIIEHKLILYTHAKKTPKNLNKQLKKQQNPTKQKQIMRAIRDVVTSLEQ